MTDRCFEIHSQTGLARTDTIDTLTVGHFQGPTEVAKAFVEKHHPGYEFLGVVRYEGVNLWKSWAINHETRMGLDMWIREVF